MNKTGVDLQITKREKFVKRVYVSMDLAIADGLKRLLDEEDLRPSCAEGCNHCCRFHILINMAEAHTLARHIRREWGEREIEALRQRTRQWYAWDYSRAGRVVPAGFDQGVDLSEYENGCPLLLNGACSVYPVRPAVCRRHYVSASPLLCQALNYPGADVETPTVLASLIAAADPYCQAIRDHVHNAGWDYDRTLMLLPHWLAIEMGWDFGVSL